MTYNIQDHGDFLEKEATTLIRNHFPYYESVWSVYIGNRGYDSIASLPNYPDENRRKHFAENSYTVLESFFMIHGILEDRIFEKGIATFNDYLEFNKAFITFFALLGRVHDTAIKASNCLNYDNRNFRESIHKFYEARSIVIHGKKVPFLFDDIGLLKIPFLKTNYVQGVAWDDRHFLWNDVGSMRIEYAADKLTDFFNQLITIINAEYATFFDIIKIELNEISTELKFEYDPQVDLNNQISWNVSGITSIEPLDVYNFKGFRPKGP